MLWSLNLKLNINDFVFGKDIANYVKNDATYAFSSVLDAGLGKPLSVSGNYLILIL